MGKANESQQHQQALHRNLVYLASFAETNQNMSQLLPVCSSEAIIKNYFNSFLIL